MPSVTGQTPGPAYAGHVPSGAATTPQTGGAPPPTYEQTNHMTELMADYKKFMAGRIAAAEQEFFAARQNANEPQAKQPDGGLASQTRAPIREDTPIRTQAKPAQTARPYSSLEGWNGPLETVVEEHQTAVSPSAWRIEYAS